jgi:AraC-like DNA-binding protein
MVKKILFRDSGMEPGFIFQIDKCPLTHDFSIHCHDFSELVVILSGSAIHIIEGREYPVSAGQVFLIHRDVCHGYKDVDNIQYVNVMFHPDQVLQLPELKLLPGFQALFYIEPFYRKEMYFKGMLELDNSQLAQVSLLLDLILEEYGRRQEGFRLMVRTYFTALIGKLSRYYQANSGREENKALRIAEAVTYLEEHFLQPITMDELAEKAFLSKRQFYRVFSSNYNTTPMDFVIRKRLDHSCMLLRDSALTISQVAMESGFLDQNYYTRQFKKMYRCTPTEYRRNRG